MTTIFPQLNTEFYLAAAPILVLILGGLVTMMQGVIHSLKGKNAIMTTFLLTLFITLALQGSGSYLFQQLIVDPLSFYGKIMVIGVALILSLLVGNSENAKHYFRGEIMSIFLFTLSGLLIMMSSLDFMTIFVGLELSSLGLYSLAGYIIPSQRSREGAVKYFVLGSIAAAFLLLGFALLYAATGSMNLEQVALALTKTREAHTWIYFYIGLIMLMVGLTFKMALAPFHSWTPDAYEGAPTLLTAFMATAAKVAVIVVIFRVLAQFSGLNQELWRTFFTTLAVASIVIGNVFALVQGSIKRMLAYSSIAHSGYLAIGLAALTQQNLYTTVDAVLFYLIAYTLMSLASFGILMKLESENNTNLQIGDLHGLAAKHPWAAFGLAVCLVSFAGIPPTVGFMAKFFLFKAALTEKLFGLVIIGVLGSALSLYYYLRLIVNMYMREAGTAKLNIDDRSRVSASLIALLVIFTLALGTFLPGPTLEKMAIFSQGLLSPKG